MLSLHALLDKVILQKPNPRSITPGQCSGINQFRKDRNKCPQNKSHVQSAWRDCHCHCHHPMELRLYLDPHHVGGDLQAGGPAQGVQEVTVTHLRGVHGQMVHVASGGRQNPQDAPQDQEVVLKGTGFLNTGTLGKISTERLQSASLQLLKYLLRDSTLLQMCQIRSTHSGLSFCNVKQ